MENVRWLIKEKYEKVRRPQGDWVSLSTQVKKVGHVTLILSVLAINNKILKYFVWPAVQLQVSLLSFAYKKLYATSF